MIGTHWVGFSLVFFMAWWVIFFMVLPFGIRHPEEPEKGHSTGAPEKAHLAIKLAVTTVLAALATWGFAALVASDLIVLRGGME